MRDVTLVDHPILQQSLTVLRRRETPARLFREELRRAATVLAVEAMRAARTARLRVETPLEEAQGLVIDDEIVIVPILRAGLAMVEGFLSLVPEARVGHIGLYRDERSHQPVDYYRNVPAAIPDAHVVVLDPMLATGRSAARAVSSLRQEGARRIQFVCLLAAPEGIEHLRGAHPNVPIIAAGLDRGLDENAFIRPGLGDAGDRSFGTS